MPADGNDPPLPVLPREAPLAHEARQFLRLVDNYLAARNLLTVAQGGDPPRCIMLIAHDLESDLPELPADHKDHERRKAERAKMQREIELNERKVQEYTFDDWTKIATAIFDGSLKCYHNGR